jgi:hypothetical protein
MVPAWCAGALLAGTMLAGGAASAEPYVPTDPAQVLQVVIPNADPRVAAIRQMSASLAAHPGDETLSLALASRQLSLGVAESDPRFVGYAQGTLAPWWRMAAPPVAIRLLRARIRQALHDFAGARRDLLAVLAADPSLVEAHLVLAGISETTGDLATARGQCDDIARLRPTLAATACAASVDSVSGHAGHAYVSLMLATSRARSQDPVLQCWALTILAEIEDRRGDPGADQHFRDALAESPGDVYTLTAYADDLLAHGRAAEVTTLLAGRDRIDALKLRLTLAARATGDAALAADIEDLAARYEAARARGEQLHQRDESRFELELRGNPMRALELARQNWAVQRTPLDARILLAAALAAKDRGTITEIADWAAATGLEDRRLRGMLDQAGKARG